MVCVSISYTTFSNGKIHECSIIHEYEEDSVLDAFNNFSKRIKKMGRPEGTVAFEVSIQEIPGE